jgi:hypothetical protein
MYCILQVTPQSCIALSETGGTASRPGTASSYWSSYDLEEGALEKAMASRQVGAAVSGFC